jgi:hypothetical protein
MLETLTTVAATVAAASDPRAYWVGAAARRGDGALVSARNGPSLAPCAAAHAERRLSRKLDRGAIVVVVRVRRDGTLAEATPCVACRMALRARGVAECWASDDTGVVRRVW